MSKKATFTFHSAVGEDGGKYYSLAEVAEYLLLEAQGAVHPLLERELTQMATALLNLHNRENS